MATGVLFSPPKQHPSSSHCHLHLLLDPPNVSLTASPYTNPIYTAIKESTRDLLRDLKWFYEGEGDEMEG